MRALAGAGAMLLVILLPACGARSADQAPAAAPAPAADVRGEPPAVVSAPTPASPSAGAESTRAMPDDAAPPSAPRAAPASRASAPEAAGGGGDREPGGSRRAALARYGAEIDVAERTLAASAGDCAAACRALGSMERAAGHVCELATSADERGRCDDVRARLRAARDRVLRTCGSCPGGPSLERSAPAPSP